MTRFWYRLKLESECLYDVRRNLHKTLPAVFTAFGVDTVRITKSCHFTAVYSIINHSKDTQSFYQLVFERLNLAPLDRPKFPKS